jgi:hypothetical protein
MDDSSLLAPPNVLNATVGVVLRDRPLRDPGIAPCQSGGHRGPPLQLPARRSLRTDS